MKKTKLVLAIAISTALVGTALLGFVLGTQYKIVPANSQSAVSVQVESEKTVFTPDAAPSQGTYIGEEKAKTIALDHADITASDVAYIYVELDFDDGIAEYEVEWNIGRAEYQYAINASTGAIIEFEVDRD